MPEPRSMAPVKPALGAFWRHHTDTDGTLFPDTVIGEQGFVFVDVTREALGKVVDKIEQRTFAVFVQALDGRRVAYLGS